MTARGESRHQRGRAASHISTVTCRSSSVGLSSASSDTGTDSSRCPTPEDDEAIAIEALGRAVKHIDVSEGTAPQTPRPTLSADGYAFASEPFMHRQLVQGRWKTIVNCPKVRQTTLADIVRGGFPATQGLDANEWIAVHLVDFWRNYSLCHELVAAAGSCTAASCPSMTIGPGASCAWRDQPSRAAPLYIDAVLAWIDGLIQDPSIFPVKAGRQFNDAFGSIAKRIWACLADLWCHLVFAHYTIFLDLNNEAYLNSLLTQCIGPRRARRHADLAAQLLHLRPAKRPGTQDSSPLRPDRS
jgi:hypothetical protein